MSKIYIKTELPAAADARRAGAIFPDWLEDMQRARPLISTTIKGLDNILGGLHGLAILGGGPGSGKTGLAVQIAQEYGKQGGPVIFLSYEQGPSGFFSRIMQRELGVSPKDQFATLQGSDSAAAVQSLKEAVKDLTNVLVYGLPSEGKGEDWQGITKTVKALQDDTGKACLVVVDSLHYVPLGDTGAALDGKRAIDKALSYLTELQQATGAAILAIAHQTKGEINAKDSGLMAFSGSATITYAADVALQITRATDDDEKPILAGDGVLVKISVPKNRLGAMATEGIEAAYNLQNQTFSDDTKAPF